MALLSLCLTNPFGEDEERSIRRLRVLGLPLPPLIDGTPSNESTSQQSEIEPSSRLQTSDIPHAALAALAVSPRNAELPSVSSPSVPRDTQTRV